MRRVTSSAQPQRPPKSSTARVASTHKEIHASNPILQCVHFCLLQAGMKKAFSKNAHIGSREPELSKAARCDTGHIPSARSFILPYSRLVVADEFSVCDTEICLSCSRELKGLYSRGRPILEESTNGASRMTRSGSCPPVEPPAQRSGNENGEENDTSLHPQPSQNGRQTAEPGLLPYLESGQLTISTKKNLFRETRQTLLSRED